MIIESFSCPHNLLSTVIWSFPHWADMIKFKVTAVLWHCAINVLWLIWNNFVLVLKPHEFKVTAILWHCVTTNVPQTELTIFFFNKQWNAPFLIWTPNRKMSNVSFYSTCIVFIIFINQAPSLLFILVRICNCESVISKKSG